MKIEIFGVRNKTTQKTYRAAARKVLRKVQTRISKNGRKINIIIVADKYIQVLNKQYLHKNQPTDVISFPLDEELWGEIYISRDRAKEQAKERQIMPEQEITNLIIHGILHLAGYTHDEMQKLRLTIP